MTYNIVTLAQRPDLYEQSLRIEAKAWSPFMYHTPTSEQYWGELGMRFAEYQLLVCEGDTRVVAVGNTIPIVWTGTLDDLPAGWDAVLEQGFHQYHQRPTTLSALAASVDPSCQSRGLGRVVIEAMKALAVRHGFADLIAPVRPSQKCRYPLIPIEHYLTWTQADGLPFDPWLRVHARMGAAYLRVAPKSMTVPGTVADWETWTELQFPKSGQYLVPGALAPVTIEHERDYGLYEEPNVWLRHRLTSVTHQ